MTLTQSQVEQINTPLDPKIVKTLPRTGSPKYVPQHEIFEAANRIFGPGGWGYTLDRTAHMEMRDGSIMYTAVVTVLVVGCQPKQDMGVGLARLEKDGSKPGPDTCETALKGAVTDGIKRGLHTFGDAFGLQLYDKDVNLVGEYREHQREQGTEGSTAQAQTPPSRTNTTTPAARPAARSAPATRPAASGPATIPPDGVTDTNQRRRLNQLLVVFPEDKAKLEGAILKDSLVGPAVAKLEARLTDRREPWAIAANELLDRYSGGGMPTSKDEVASCEVQVMLGMVLLPDVVKGDTATTMTSAQLIDTLGALYDAAVLAWSDIFDNGEDAEMPADGAA